MTNKKKSIKLLNPTKHFDAEVCRTYNTISSPHSYQSRNIKIEGYETRLYWQYRYCEEHDGQTFFYTLTYNDKNMPWFYGMRCFDYEDLVGLLTGGFRKMLLRKYGTSFKYFVGAELGDGKGVRGMANNPHYHVLFFLESANNPRYPYQKISPEDFRHLVRMYWQGFDEDEDKKNHTFHDYRDAKKGIAREGENLGLVTDFRACTYCAKYVTKDVKLKRRECFVENQLNRDVYDLRYDDGNYLKGFYEDVIKPKFFGDETIPRYHSKADGLFDCDSESVSSGMTDYDIFLTLTPLEKSSFYLKHRIAEKGDIRICAEPVITSLKSYETFVPDIIDRYNLRDEYSLYVHEHIEDEVHERFNEYRNRYSNKCRISHGVGDYALLFINDKLNPTTQVPDKNGFKNRPLSQYYYRKLFTDLHIDEDGSPRRIINEDGIRYKMNKLPEQIARLARRAEGYLNLVKDDSSLYRKMEFSDVNEQVFAPYSEFFEELDYLLNENNITNITQRYAEYKLIYEHRYFAVPCGRSFPDFDFPPINVNNDYLRFISSIGIGRNDYRTTSFFEDATQNYVSYDSHSYFLRYLGVFRVLDLCSDYFFVQNDDKKQREAEEISAVKRFHDKQRLNDFYGKFIR